MSWLDHVAEARLREAVEGGAFRDLPGEGRPLELEDLSRVPEDLRSSYALLKGANVLPEELELRKELVTLESLLAACREGDDLASLRSRLESLEIRYAILMERRRSRPISRDYRAAVARRLARRRL